MSRKSKVGTESGMTWHHPRAIEAWLNNGTSSRSCNRDNLVEPLRSCHAPLHKGCPKHQGHKGDPGVTPGICGAGGENAQVILVWVRAPGVGNASHPRRLGVMRVRPSAMCSSWRKDSRMLRNTSIWRCELADMAI
jgi:hypothetical protein